MRASRQTEVEIRPLSVQVLQRIQKEAPHLFEGDELTPLFKFVKEQTKIALSTDGDNALPLLRDLSQRAGFGSIEEEVLIAFKSESPDYLIFKGDSDLDRPNLMECHESSHNSRVSLRTRSAAFSLSED